MGYDYSSIHVFTGDNESKSIRAQIINYLPQIINGLPVPQPQANRSIVIGPPSRWIFVGDTASQTEDGDRNALNKLINKLSNIAPTLAIHMFDSGCVHLYLNHNGEIVDKFGTDISLWEPFQSEEEAKAFKGIEEKWAPYSLDINGVDKLRSIWDKKNNVDCIVKTTANILGIHPELARCGYTIFDEADEIYYRDWIDDKLLLSKEFSEYHFLSTLNE